MLHQGFFPSTHKESAYLLINFLLVLDLILDTFFSFLKNIKTPQQKLEGFYDVCTNKNIQSSLVYILLLELVLTHTLIILLFKIMQ